ncbi:MAG: ABC transporter substrate-binding protein [Brevundimonas sp.]
MGFPHRRAVIGAGLAAAGLGLSACGRSEAPLDEQGRVRLRFAADGPARAAHGGFYQALASGAYGARNLNVQILPDGPDVDVPQLLASGAVELGMAASSFTPLTLVAEGAPVKAVAAYFQKDPQVLITHPDAAPAGIADLAGRPVLMGEDARESLWPWLQARYGFTDDQLQAPAEGLEPFLADDRAVLAGDLTRDPFAVRQAGGFEPRVFLPADEDYPSYGCMVLAPNAFARDNEEALRAFIAASAEGWHDYLNGDPAAADALILADHPDMTAAMLAEARETLREHQIVQGGDAAIMGIGAMTRERWRAFFEATAEAGIYPQDLDWREAFTLEYLPGRG